MATEQPGTFLIIFGITGDLAQRKLLPALYELVANDLVPKHFRIIGISRSPVSSEELIKNLNQKHSFEALNLKKMASLLEMVQLDLTSVKDYRTLNTHLNDLEKQAGVAFQRLFYLSMPPTVFGPVIDTLHSSGLSKSPKKHGIESRIIIEKPFGYNLDSAQELIDRISEAFTEKQIYRIDHYLAKETAQNILTFRFGNPFFEETWNRRFVKKIVIKMTESIGIEGRAKFYEQTGALRDLIQSHLLQIMALVTMEEPTQLNAENIHLEKLRLLERVIPIEPNQVEECTVRGQYEGYREEVGNSDSITETYAAIKLFIDNPRWKGVPIIIETGKGLSEKSTSATLYYKSKGTDLSENPLTIQIQPNEGIGIGIWVKKPGFTNELHMAEMDFRYERSFKKTPADAYQRVLIDAIRGDQSLFASSAEIIQSWKILNTLTHAWEQNGTGMFNYQLGTESTSLLQHLRS